jgi:hypothetical protein
VLTKSDGSLFLRQTNPNPFLFPSKEFPMFERISNGWQLAQQSWRVLMLDKELLLFPLISGVACLLVMATFAVPLWASGYLDAFADPGENGVGQTQQIIGYVILFAYYFVNYFVIIFFNSALITCAVIRFKGHDPTLADGFSAAFSRLPQIAGWALVAATVGVILKIIESRSQRVGQIVAGLLGMAWSAVTYFVVPVIVVERKGPIEAAKRSLQVLKKTWGEALVANFGIGMIVFLATLIAMIPLIAGAVAIASGLVAVGILGIVIGIVALLLVSLISSALNAIIIGALYLYAADGTVPQHFDSSLLRDAFAEK